MIPAIIVDIDGTLAIRPEGYSPYDPKHYELNSVSIPVLEVVNRFATTHKILVVSGRSDIYEEVTEQWLMDSGVPYDELWLRPSILHLTEDTKIKHDIYYCNIKDKYDVLFVLDDRDRVVKMWRGLGLTCFQVAEGNF